MMNLIIIYLLVSTILTIVDYISTLLTAKKLHLNLYNVTLLKVASASKWIIGIPVSPILFVLSIVAKIPGYILLKMYSKEVLVSAIDNIVEKDKTCKTEEDKALLKARTLKVFC